MAKFSLLTHNSDEKIVRTVAKTVIYRTIIIILDFIAVYLLSGKVSIAIGYTVISNIYTSIAYYLHERIWSKIKWGTIPHVSQEKMGTTSNP